MNEREAVQTRLDQLARQNRRLWTFNVIALLAFSAAMVIAASGDPSDDANVEARRFTVVDEAGRPRVIVGPAGDGATGFLLLDETGARRGRFVLEPVSKLVGSDVVPESLRGSRDMRPHLQLFGPGGDVGISLSCRDEIVAVDVDEKLVVKDLLSIVRLSGEKGNGVELGAGRLGPAYVELRSEEGVWRKSAP